MGEILPRHYIIGIIMFTLFIMGGLSLIGEMAKTNSGFVDNTQYGNFNDTFNVYDDITTEVGGLQDTITEADADPGIFGVLGSLISASWNALKGLFASFGFMNAIFEGLESFMGVPGWVGGLLILLVTVLLSFAIYSAIFQRDL